MCPARTFCIDLRERPNVIVLAASRAVVIGGPTGVGGSHFRVREGPVGLGDVARRMISRTTDLIAIGIVVVASLSLGRQVLVWWHTAPPTRAAAEIGSNSADHVKSATE